MKTQTVIVVFLLVASSQASQMPSDAPSLVPSDTPSMIPSAAPSSLADASLNELSVSDFPSTLPSGAPSTIPSDHPSNSPSTVPSDVPSGAPSQSPSAAPSNAPSDVPSQTPSAAPSDAPSDVPSQSPSDVPSTAPSLGPSQVPSSTPSQEPTVAPSGLPTGSPSTSPTAVPTPIPTMQPSFKPTEFPTGVPSFSPSVAASASPSNAPTRLLESLETMKVTETSVTIQSLSAALMTQEQLEQFESTCTQVFLPEFLPRVQDIAFEQISCKVLDQRIVNSSRMLRKLQDTESGPTAINVKVQVSAHADVSDEVFSDIVSGAFDVFRDDFSSVLSTASSTFAAPSVAQNTDRFSPIQSDSQPESEDSDWWKDWSETSLVVLVASVVGGAVLAVVLAVFAVRRRRGHSANRPDFNRVLTNENVSGVKVFVADSSSDQEDEEMEEVDRRSSSTTKAYIVPESLGISSGDSSDEIMLSVTKPENVPPEPDRLNSFKESDSMESSKEATKKEKQQTNFAPPLNRSSDEESSLKGLRYIASIRTSSEKSNKKSVITPFNFGFRRKYSDRSRFLNSYDDKARYLSKSGSEFSDVSIDPKRPAGTPTASSRSNTKLEDCVAATPRSNFIRQKQTPKGDRFVQMSINEALHTGDVLDDLGRLENEVAGKSVMGDTKFSYSSAETPKQRNSSRLLSSARDTMTPVSAVSGIQSVD